MAFVDDLLKICEEVRTVNGYAVGAQIPEKKLVNAREKFPLPRDVSVLALVDSTTFGSNKTGLAVTSRGISFRNLMGKGVALSWKKLASMTVEEKKNDLVFGGKDAYYQSGAAFEKGELLALVKSLQERAKVHFVEIEAEEALRQAEEWRQKKSQGSAEKYEPVTVHEMVGAQDTAKPEGSADGNETAGAQGTAKAQPSASALGIAGTPAKHHDPAGETTPVASAEARSVPEPLLVEPAVGEDTAAPKAVHLPTYQIDLNRATEDELALLPGVGPLLAKAAVSIRESSGPYKSVRHFVDAIGLREHMAERIKPYVKEG